MAASPPSQIGPKERFFDYFRQEVTALLQQMGRLKDLALVGGERSDAADHCLAGIARLSKEVQDASSYVPAYDQRTYGEAIKALNEELATTRARLMPKSKFAFKKNSSAISLSDAAELASAQRMSLPGYRPDPPSEESSIATTPAYLATPPNGATMPSSEREQYNTEAHSQLPSSSATNIRKPSFSSSKSVAISSLVGQHIILPSSAAHATSSGSLTNLRRCVVDMSIPTIDGEPFAGLTIKNIKSSLLVCGSVNGAIHITDVEGSVIIITTRQFRMHDCKDCVVYLHCNSRPIIEGCHGISFSPIPKLYANSKFPSANQWDQVDDFKWLKADHSPNWSILPSENIVPEEKWIEILPGGPEWSLEDILHAVGVDKLSRHS